MGNQAGSKSFKRRRCNNCPTVFLPARGWQVFCSATCRKQYHEHGGAYVKLRGLVERLIERRFDAIQRDLNSMVAEKLDAAEKLMVARAVQTARAETLRALTEKR